MLTKSLLWAIEPDWLETVETVYMFVMSNVMPFYLSAHRELAIVRPAYTSNYQALGTHNHGANFVLDLHLMFDTTQQQHCACYQCNVEKGERYVQLVLKANDIW